MKSAVIVLIDEESNSILLTQRSQQLRYHPGEVCFPGGMYELSDSTLYDTALRELHEELSIAPDRVQLIKPLNIEYTLRKISIQPWLASISRIQPYKINEEVAEVFLVDKQIINNPSNYNEITINKEGVQITSLQFMYKEYYIWGATARILRQLVGKP